MSVDELIDGLSAEAGEAVRPLLQQAYERGFREALAGAGRPVEAEAPAPVPVELPPAATPAPAAPPVTWAPAPSSGADGPRADGGEDDGGDESAEEERAGDAPAPRPIQPNAKVGTLRRRIIRTFDLERFDVDVVICRSGDPDRRQLKSSARLASYRREEG